MARKLLFTIPVLLLGACATQIDATGTPCGDFTYVSSKDQIAPSVECTDSDGNTLKVGAKEAKGLSQEQLRTLLNLISSLAPIAP